MQLTVGQASKEIGKAKTTVSRAIKKGKLSAKKNDDGSYSIDPAELFRAFPPKVETVKAQPHATASEQAQLREIELLQRLVSDQKERITGLEADKERIWGLLENLQGKQPEPARKGLWGRVFGSVAVLVFVVGASPLMAAFQSGNDWLSEPVEYQLGYVAGAVDAFETAFKVEAHAFGWMVECTGYGDGSWTVRQVRAVFEKYYADHPERRYLAASAQLHNALWDACE